jgi:hypothetical protein
MFPAFCGAGSNLPSRGFFYSFEHSVSDLTPERSNQEKRTE